MLHKSDHIATRMLLLTEDELALLQAALLGDPGQSAGATASEVGRAVVAKILTPYRVGAAIDAAPRQERVVTPLERERAGTRAAAIRLRRRPA